MSTPPSAPSTTSTSESFVKRLTRALEGLDRTQATILAVAMVAMLILGAVIGYSLGKPSEEALEKKVNRQVAMNAMEDGWSDADMYTRDQVCMGYESNPAKFTTTYLDYLWKNHPSLEVDVALAKDFLNEKCR